MSKNKQYGDKFVTYNVRPESREKATKLRELFDISGYELFDAMVEFFEKNSGDFVIIRRPGEPVEFQEAD